MTTDEAKKAGFRTDANGWATTWRILNTSEIRRLNSKVRGLDANDFPTRAKARESLLKRKMEEAKPSETPAEKDARIKALVDSYVDKGGPITAEQLTDEVSLWCDNHNISYYNYNRLGRLSSYWNKADAEHAKWLADMQAQMTPITPEQLALLHVGKDTVWAVHIAYGNSITREIYDGNKTFKCFHFSEASALAAKQRLDDYEHEKWIKNHQSQTTPITKEQGKMLRDGDTWYWACPTLKPMVIECHELECSLETCGSITLGQSYFTRAAAQAALDKAKAEAEPLEWCERKVGEAEPTDELTLSDVVDLQAKSGGRNDIPHAHTGWASSPSTLPNGWTWATCQSNRIRARYRNPLWLAKHGNKGMIYNNNTDKWEPEPTKTLDDFPINKEEPTYSTEMHSNTEDLTLQTSLVLNHERGKTPSKFISFANYKGIIPDRFTLDMKNFNLPALQGLINTNFVPIFRGQPKEVVTDETQPTILEEAAKCVTGPRRRDYGTPDENFGLIAKLWSLQLHHEVTPSDVAMCLILLKVARQCNSPKRDNLVDIAGYAQCASELKGAK